MHIFSSLSLSHLATPRDTLGLHPPALHLYHMGKREDPEAIMPRFEHAYGKILRRSLLAAYPSSLPSMPTTNPPSHHPRTPRKPT
jgi:hypothetical protein